MSERAFRFRDISVRKKIAATLGVLVFIICGTGLFSADRLMRVHQTTTEINTNWLPSIRYIDEVRYNMARHRAIISRHVMTSELEKKRSIEGRLLLVEKKIEERRKLYEPLIASATEGAQYDAFVSAWQAYLASCARMLTVSTQGDNAEGAKLFLGEVSSGGLKAETTIDKIVETNLAGADAAEQAGAALYTSSRYLLIALGGLAVLFALASGYVLTRGVALPVNAMTAAMTRLAGGDLDIPIPASGQHDEIGKMAAAVQVFKDNMIETERLRGEQVETEQRQAQQRKSDMVKMADNFENAVGEIIETVSSASTELETSAGTLTSSAERAQELTRVVASASDEASTNVQSVASATEEMVSSINEISRQVQESARMANEAVDQARKTNDRVGELSKAAARIGDVVELISTIAGQTNLLALNATIEAARAGEAGRGFAVVASEVKALAEQTAKATGEIGQQISGIQAATQESVGAIKEISDTIGKLSEISSTIAAAVEEQGAATQEISRNVQQAAQGTQQVSSNITDVQRGATETGSASSQVLSSAQSLSTESNRLKLEVGKFLNTVRAA